MLSKIEINSTDASWKFTERVWSVVFFMGYILMNSIYSQLNFWNFHYNFVAVNKYMYYKCILSLINFSFEKHCRIYYIFVQEWVFWIC